MWLHLWVQKLTSFRFQMKNSSASSSTPDFRITCSANLRPAPWNEFGAQSKKSERKLLRDQRYTEYTCRGKKGRRWLWLLCSASETWRCDSVSVIWVAVGTPIDNEHCGNIEMGFGLLARIFCYWWFWVPTMNCVGFCGSNFQCLLWSWASQTISLSGTLRHTKTFLKVFTPILPLMYLIFSLFLVY